ncbi:hypothetical protein JCM1840_004116 [Sporobolomyces johnsonii]
MPPDWSYKVSLKPSHPAAPSLALVAGAAVPPTVGPDSLFAASTVTLATLSLQLAAQYPSGTSPTGTGTGTGTASSRPSSPSSSRPSAQASLEKALLLIAKHTLSPDVWSPSSCATNNANQPGMAKKGKGQKRGWTEEGTKGEGGGGRKAKRAKGGKGTMKMRRKEQDREDDEALAVMGCEIDGEGGDELEVGGESELGGLEGFEDLVARAEDEEGGDWEGKEKGEYAALEQEGEEEDLALGFDDEDEEQGWRVEGGVLSGDDAGDGGIDERFVADGRDDPDGMELLLM